MTHHLNHTPLQRELWLLEHQILRLEILQNRYDHLTMTLENSYVDEDDRHHIYAEMTDLEVELVLLEACYDRKVKLEAMT
jgi:hypothetical protein